MSDTVIKVENLSYFNHCKIKFRGKLSASQTKIAGAMPWAGCDGMCDKIATMAVRY